MKYADKFLLTATAILLVSIGFGNLFSEDANKVKWSLNSASVSIAAGGSADVTVQADIDDTWYIYGLEETVDEFGIGPSRTEFVLQDFADGITLASSGEPRPKTKYDKGFDFDIQYHEKSAGFELEIAAAAGLAPGSYNGKLIVYFQACDPKRCLPPDSKEFDLTIEVSAGGAVSGSALGSAAGNAAAGSDHMLETPVEETGMSSAISGASGSAGDLANASYDELVEFSVEQPEDFYITVGDTAYVTVKMKIKDGWYSYSMVEALDEYGLGPQNTTFTLVADPMLGLGAVTESAPIVEYDEVQMMDVGKHKKEATFRVPIYVDGEAILEQDNSEQPLQLKVTYQICKDGACLAPTEHTIYLNPTVKATTWGYLIIAMLAGAGALLTPCVFPMIPITVSFFTKRSEKNPGRGVADSLVYSIGIILTFVLLGAVLTALLGPTGVRDFSTNPWVNLAIATVFIVFAFNLFGAFEIQIPTALLNKLNTASGDGKGFTGIILMALTFSLTSFTCTVPFIGTAFISSGGDDMLKPILGMTAFATVFALPFFFLALFPAVMHRLPKAGGWMNNIKVVMGFVELAAAVKFLSNAELVWGWQVLPRDLFLAIWIGCAIFITIYILGLFRFSHDSPVESVGAPRAMFALFFASISFYLFTGLLGKNLGMIDSFMPPDDNIYYANFEDGVAANIAGPGSGALDLDNIGGEADGPNNEEVEEGDFLSKMAQKHAGENIYLNYDEALAESKRTGKPLFVDFTGKTCTNCRLMEKTMFPKASVQQRLDQMVIVHLYTDLRTPESDRYKNMQEERYKDITLPLYVILTPDEQLISKAAYTTDESAFVAFLDRAL